MLVIQLLVSVESGMIENCTSDHGKKSNIQHPLTLLSRHNPTGIQFVKQPVDARVCLNGAASFSCSFSGNGTNLRPQWMINSTIYSSSSLPSNTRYDPITDTLIVNNVTADQNNVTYQCFFPFHDGSKLCDILSSIGRLQLYSVTPGKMT